MCENFICSKLKPPDHSRKLADQSIPEPCFENTNCQICELMYDCAYCAAKDDCLHGNPKTQETMKNPKNTVRKHH